MVEALTNSSLIPFLLILNILSYTLTFELLFLHGTAVRVISCKDVTTLVIIIFRFDLFGPVRKPSDEFCGTLVFRKAQFTKPLL